MIDFKQTTLENGLKIIAHQDTATPMACVNVLYKVGSRNENPSHTGLAHLFEHLMFGGSTNVPSFDEPLQIAGGENNAFTSNDYTNYYIAIPSNNIQTALWAESDRMANLVLNQNKIEIERNVVVEEFAQRYINQPYGDMWPTIRSMCYAQDHPYSWATIGKNREQILQTNLDDALSFYNKFYNPSNAILSIASPQSVESTIDLAHQWFGDIKGHKIEAKIEYPDPIYGNRVSVERDVASSVIYICFPIEGRMHRSTIVLDVVSDILSGGDSSRLEHRLVKVNPIFSSVNCYITGEQGPGLLALTATLMPATTLDEAQEALWAQIDEISNTECSDYELQKVRNKFEANNYFSQINSMNKAMNLAYYEFLGSASLINDQVTLHHSVQKAEIMEICQSMLTRDKAHTLYYKAQDGQ